MDGKVRVINEDISLTTDYMELFYNLAEISNDIEIVRIYCDGNVLIEFDDQLITSQIAEYDLNSNSLLLKKEVLISKSEGNNIKAEEVIVDLNTMRITMKSDERVRAFITPNNLNESLMITDALNIEAIVKDYNSKNVINNISMSINPGEIIGLLGPNGAGKTTLFYIIMGLIRPNSGQIKLDGHDITKLAMYSRARLGISYLPQEPSIFRGMNVRDNINCVLEITEKNSKLRKIKLEKLIEIFGLEKIQKSSARVLSGGERRRVEIARSIATQPKYILMDEPFSGVDPIAIEEIKKIIKSLSDNNIGIIITDHNVRDTLSLVDRAYLIYEGRILISGSPDEILNSDDAKRVYLGNDFNI